ncbi:MAG TPA: tetratricopeptide repeat protein [Luteimonas sp.]
MTTLVVLLLSGCAAASQPGSEELERGEAYAFGRGVVRDDARAAELFLAAAEKGHPEAQYKLAVLLENGHGVTRDYGAAMAWYLEAADNGHSGAQSNIGSMHARGLGMPSDQEEAARWYRRAAENGGGHGSYNLGMAYLQGEGVPQDHALALEHFSAAEQLGVEAASARVRELRLHAGVEACGPLPADYRGQAFGEALYAVVRPCERTLSATEQAFLAGIAEYLVNNCGFPADPADRDTLQRFRMSSTLVSMMGTDYRNPDFINSQIGMHQAQAAYVGGTAVARSAGCNAAGSALADGIVAHVARSQSAAPGKAGFVDGCAEYYASRYSRDQCQCVADVGAAVMPGIHKMSFDSSAIKDVIERNPLLGMQLAFQCRIRDY